MSFAEIIVPSLLIYYRIMGPRGVIAFFFASAVLLPGCGREEPPRPVLLPAGGAERRAAAPPGREGPPSSSHPPPAPLAVNLAVPRRSMETPPDGKPPGDPLGLNKGGASRRPAGLALPRPRARSEAAPASREPKSAPPQEGRPSHPPPESLDSQQEGALKPGVPGSRYLSPARPKEGKVAEPKVAAATQSVAAKIAAPSSDLDAKTGEAQPPSAKGLNADIMNAVVDPLEVGSYRVQVSQTEDFRVVLFDRTFAFLESQEVEADLRRALPKGGRYWVRHAFIDLLEFQLPNSAPKRYRFRPRR